MLAKPTMRWPGISIDQPDLRAAWLCNEGAGQNFIDVTGHGHNGTFNAVELPDAWVGSALGNGLLFDGTDGYIDLGTSFSAHSGIVTIEAVVTFDNTASAVEQIVSSESGGGLAERNFQFRRQATGELRVVVFYDGANSANSESTLALAADTTYYVVGINDGVECRVYIDGRQSGTSTATGSMNTNALSWHVGKEDRGDTGFPNMRLDFLAVHFGVLSDKIILTRAADPFLPFREPDLTALWGSAVGAPAGLSIPVAMHHYTKNIRVA